MIYDDSSIVRLSGLETVTESPEVLVGDLESLASLHQMIKEIVDNSNDEAGMVDRFDFVIDIIFFRRGKRYQCLVGDRGRGIPPKSMYDVCTRESTGSKYTKGGRKSAYTFSAGTYGRGLKAPAALSTQFCAISKREDGSGFISIQDADIKRSEVIGPFEDNRAYDGTIIFHEPSPKYFTQIPNFLKGEGLAHFVDYCEFLSTYTVGSRIKVSIIDELIPKEFFNKSVEEIWKEFKFKEHGKVIYETDPNMTPEMYVRKKLSMPETINWSHKLMLPLSEENKKLGYGIEMYLADDFNDLHKAKFVSSINSISMLTEDSYQVHFLFRSLKDRMGSLILDPKVRSFFLKTYRLPMYFSINVVRPGASFLGLIKDSYKERTFGSDYTQALDRDISANLSMEKLNDLYQLISDHLNDAYERYIKKTVLNTGGMKNISSRLNKFNGYVDCIETDPAKRELYLVEGESAFGSAKKVRRKQNQAILQSQGKPINPEKAEPDQVLKNKVFQDLVAVLGIGPGDPIEKINFHNIFLCADPDAHGVHINSIYLAQLNFINPEIIKRGYVKVIIPPLYHLRTKKASMFIRDSDALFEFKVNNVLDQVIDLYVGPKKGQEGNLVHIKDSTHLFDLYAAVDRIGRIMTDVGRQYGIQALLFEAIVHRYEHLEPVNSKGFEDINGVGYVKFYDDTNTLIFGVGDIELSTNITGMYEDIVTRIIPMYQRLHKNQFDFFVTLKGNDGYDKKRVSLTELYSIMEILTDNEKKAIYSYGKFKGLGSMDTKLLEPTCFDPQTRVYIPILGMGDMNKFIDMLGTDASARKYLTGKV